MRPLRFSALSALLVCLVACEIDALPSESNLDRLRILAAQAEPAEAAPGDTVTLRSLTWSPDGAEVGVVWEVCMDFGCPNPNLSARPGALLAAGELDMEAGVIGLEPDLPPTFMVPPTLLDDLDEARAVEGLVLRFGLSATRLPASEHNPDAEVEWATKDLAVGRSSTPNHNPVLLGIVLDGEPVAEGESLVVSGGALSLAVEDEQSIAETYTYINSDGVEEEREETIDVAWYTDLGTISGDTWQPGRGARQGELLVVLRDGRGGSSWLQFDVNRQ